LVSGSVAFVVFAIVFCDIPWKGVHGPVSGGVGDVMKERLICVIFEVGFKIVYSVVRYGVGVIPSPFRIVFGVILRSDLGVITGE
jgi:hypothetical protein